MEAARLLPYEMVQITNMSNATRWETYVIRGPKGSGAVCLNGPPARLFQPGDEVIILSFQYCAEEEAGLISPRVVFLDRNNRVTTTRQDEAPFESYHQNL